MCDWKTSTKLGIFRQLYITGAFFFFWCYFIFLHSYNQELLINTSYFSDSSKCRGITCLTANLPSGIKLTKFNWRHKASFSCQNVLNYCSFKYNMILSRLNERQITDLKTGKSDTDKMRRNHKPNVPVVQNVGGMLPPFGGNIQSHLYCFEQTLHSSRNYFKLSDCC